MPEVWGWRIEFNRGVKTFGHGLGAADDFAGNAIFGGGVLENQVGIDGKALVQHEQRAIVIHADGHGVEGSGFALQRDVDAGTHAKEDALAAAAILGSGSRSHGGGNRL